MESICEDPEIIAENIKVRSIALVFGFLCGWFWSGIYVVNLKLCFSIPSKSNLGVQIMWTKTWKKLFKTLSSGSSVTEPATCV